MIDLRSDRVACPDLETLAACIDERLGAADRAAAEAHLAGCETCRELLADAQAAMEGAVQPA